MHMQCNTMLCYLLAHVQRTFNALCKQCNELERLWARVCGRNACTWRDWLPQLDPVLSAGKGRTHRLPRLLPTRNGNSDFVFFLCVCPVLNSFMKIAWTERTSVSPECWCAAHFFGRRVRSRFIATTWPSLVAGAAANWLQDCCSHVSVSARTYSGVPVCWSTEHQGPAIETAITVMVVGHVSRPCVEPVHCRRPRFPDCRCTSLEHSVRSSSSLSTFKRRLNTELFSRSFPDWCDRMNFRYICKVASQLWLTPP